MILPDFPVLKRRTHATPHLLREVWLPGQIRCKHNLLCFMSHPWLFSHAPSSMSTSSSPPVLPHTENTQYIPHISKFLHSTSCAIKNNDLFMPRRMEFKGWVTDYKQCRYQGLTEVSNLINDLHKMVPDALKKYTLIGSKPGTNKESGQPK